MILADMLTRGDFLIRFPLPHYDTWVAANTSSGGTETGHLAGTFCRTCVLFCRDFQRKPLSVYFSKQAEANMKHVNSLRTIGFLVCVHRQELKQLENTRFRKLELVSS
jgi:hypothetical protein